MPVKVFGSPTSPEVARVMTCLFEKEIEFQLICVDSFRSTKRLPQPPHGEAVAFEDGDVTLVESRKILRHIAEKYKDQGNRDLFGPGALEQASIEQWLETGEKCFDVPSADMLYSLAYLQLDGRGAGAPAAGMSPSSHRQKLEEMRQLLEKNRREVGKLLDIYDQRFGETEYLACDNFTIADLSHLPNADSIAADPRLAHLIESRRNVRRWWDTISRRDSWSRVKELQRSMEMEAPC